MSKNIKKILTYFLAVYIIIQSACFLFFAPQSAIAATSDVPKFTIPDIQIKIPGMAAFSQPHACPDDPNKTCVNWISEYIAGVYQYAIGIVGILATVVMMFGGFLYLTAGGESSKVSEAKEWIKASLTGLIIALSSYMILYQVNPELVNLKPIKMTKVSEPATTTGVFLNQASSELSNIISCLNGKLPGLVITSKTDDDIATGKCNPTDPNETFNDDNNCVHSKNSCHYGGTDCISKGSYAIDVSLSTNGSTLAAAVAECGNQYGLYDIPPKCWLNEGNTHHHVSIGSSYSCGCDYGLQDCYGQ